MNWYEREALSAARRFGWHPTCVASALLILDTRVNEGRMLASAPVFAVGFAGRAPELQALVGGDLPSHHHRFVAMIDPRSRRSRWLRATRSDGRRSAAPYVDYIDAARRMESRLPARRRSDPAVASIPNRRT